MKLSDSSEESNELCPFQILGYISNQSWHGISTPISPCIVGLGTKATMMAASTRDKPYLSLFTDLVVLNKKRPCKVSAVAKLGMF